MIRSGMLKGLTILCVGLAMLLLGHGCGPGGDRYVLVTGGTTGVYYPAGQTIARIIRAADVEFRLDVRPSGGSVANARELGTHSADFALIQNDIAAYATEGAHMFEGDSYPNIRGVAALYPEHIQIVAAADAGIDSLDDLAGRRIAIGDRGSGTEANAMQILEAAGLELDDFARVERIGPGQIRDYLQDGRIDAGFFTFGVPTAAIQELTYQLDISFVPVDGQVRQRLMDSHPFYREAAIPAEAYREADNRQRAIPDDEVQTVSVMATLAAREEIPAHVVEQLLQSIFNDLDTFQGGHARLADVTRESAQADLTLPLHDGAAAFYEGTPQPEDAEVD